MSSLRLKYQTIEFGGIDIHVRTLRNRQEYSNQYDDVVKSGVSSSTWSLFGVVWASGELLSHIMMDYKVKGLRILEVGCGIGLASLILNNRSADITATDHNPDAEHFLSENVLLNNGDDIPFICTSWAELGDDLGEFDLIIGSDLLYEPDHAELLSNFIDHHSKPCCKVIIVDPGREHHKEFRKRMVDLGYSHSEEIQSDISMLTQPMRGLSNFRVLSYQR